MKQKKVIERLAVGAVFLIAALFVKNQWLDFALFLIAYVIIGGDVVKKAVRNIGHGQVFDENFLMTVATIGAFLIREYPEAVSVMLFYQVGELFNAYAVDKSRKSITEAMDINPDYANVIRDGVEEKVDPYDVAVEETIVIKPGERVPLDGVVTKGSSSLDTKALTGESVPRDIGEGEEIISGCINLNGVLEVRVTKEFDDSTVTKILELVENASSRKAKAENFITKFARFYTPIVVLVAAALAVIPPAIGFFIAVPFDTAFTVWLYRALSFLVVSCPCALVISIPLGFFGGLGAASKQGILMKGSNYLEAMGNLEIAVFDKTGTLTTGNFKVVETRAEGGASVDRLLDVASCAEYYSNHPIATSVKEASGKEVDKERLGEVEEISGHGVSAHVDGKRILVGNKKLMDQFHIVFEEAVDALGTVLYVAEEETYLGYVVIGDQVREDVPAALAGLKKAGVKKLVMLTGDKESVGQTIGKRLGMDQVFAELLPADKVAKVEELLGQKGEKGTLAFVGDGINDAPVLARADVGIAMGGIGSDAAVEAADVVIMTDEPSKLVAAIGIARKTVRIVNENIVFAIGIKVAVLILVAFGMASMWAAVFADVGVSVLAILNAIRVLRVSVTLLSGN